jgi:short-subunit dehydrogenase
MTTVVVITGASSGIGAALARTAPYDAARVIGVSRRVPPCGEHLAADLADPGVWAAVAERVGDAVAGADVDAAVLLHFAGVGTPYGRADGAPLGEYAASVLLNAAAGPVLGTAFLQACRRRGTPATVVMCSSPAAATPMPGMSHYGAGKRALEYWTAAVAAEHAGGDARVLAVVPFPVDTPRVRDVIEQPPEVQPVAAVLRAAADDGALASAEDTAAEIWRLVVDDGHAGEVVPVGAVPPGVRP